MKRFILALAMVTAIAFVGCNKDDASSDLAGTTWKCSEAGYSETLSFKSGGQVSSSWQSGTSKGYGSGTYTYNHPSINITIADDGDIFIYSGTVEGRVMRLTSYGELYIFNKM